MTASTPTRRRAIRETAEQKAARYLAEGRLKCWRSRRW